MLFSTYTPPPNHPPLPHPPSLCRTVFEARKCMRDLTEECDEATKMSVSVALETAVTRLGGNVCSQDSILLVCYETLVERIDAILSFSPFDPPDWEDDNPRAAPPIPRTVAARAA